MASTSYKNDHLIWGKHNHFTHLRINIFRYFCRPCDEFTERVCPIKISDGARVTLFNKGLLYHAFSFFLLSTAVQYLMIPREEVELDDVTSYNIFDNKIYKISS